ncbi:hypothetical protein FB107DRAFT_205683 [Schizophyllum commune]
MDVPVDSKATDLWFPDGNIIVRAGDHTCRVYKGFLASLSTVLSDMFSLPQTPESFEMMDGVPVVVLPDPPNEAVCWLKAMLLPDFFQPYPHVVESEHLLTVLRLSHKYDVPYLRRRALEHLAAYFLVDVDAVQAEYKSGPYAMHLQKPIYHFLALAHNVADEIGALWLIPCAVYKLHEHICQMPELLDFLPDIPDSSALQIAKRLYKLLNLVPVHFPDGPLLRGRDHCQCMQVQDPGIVSAAAEGLRTQPLYYYDSLGYRQGGADLLRPGHEYEQAAHPCVLCSTLMRSKYSAACAAFWAALPSTLGLPDWPELLESKARDLQVSQ